jgi:2-oxoglutarate ferredoxin oxidoreductase subunit gamma
MYEDVIIAGFGGQGVMLIGNLLAYAAMEQGLNVTYMPVYGVEMRGGTANCTVVISDEEIGSPIIFHPKSVIVMNQPSLEKFQPRLIPGGLLIVNSSIVDTSLVDKTKYKALLVPVNNIADEEDSSIIRTFAPLITILLAREYPSVLNPKNTTFSFILYLS